MPGKYRAVVDEGYLKDEPVGQRWGKVFPFSHNAVFVRRKHIWILSFRLRMESRTSSGLLRMPLRSTMLHPHESGSCGSRSLPRSVRRDAGRRSDASIGLCITVLGEVVGASDKDLSPRFFARVRNQRLRGDSSTRTRARVPFRGYLRGLALYPGIG